MMNFFKKTVETTSKIGKNYGRIETRTAYVTHEIMWLEQREEWKNRCCIGAIHTVFETKNGKTSEGHYYISSRKLTPEQLLHHARMQYVSKGCH